MDSLGGRVFADSKTTYYSQQTYTEKYNSSCIDENKLQLLLLED